MAAAPFDTLAAARDLEAAGIERAQAEAIASAIRHGHGELATKADLVALKADLVALTSALENRMLEFAIGLMVANVALAVTLIKLP